MNVFLSHAIIDQCLAERIKQLLIEVSLGLIKPWLSSSLDGLKPGDVLWNELHGQLKTADKIITILTPNSYLRPWLLYESGFVAGCRGDKVIPLVCSVKKSDLPSPLSAYVIYSTDDPEDFIHLIIQLVSEVVPSPSLQLIEHHVAQFHSDLPGLVKKPSSQADTISQIEHLEALDIQFINKLKASEIFHRRLADPDIKDVIIVTYTNEVESGSINHYRVKGKKNITIYKRSIFADLSEQQKYNLLRIAAGSSVRLWNKKEISLRASRDIENEFLNDQDVKINQFFYDSPPTKRAFLFDNREAIISYYEKNDNFILTGGTIYKGMNNKESLWVSDKSDLGKYLIDELLQYIESVKIASHSWRQENESLKKGIVWRRAIRKPCVQPKAVFLDMDGVLYDSLPQYVKAWQLGFKEVGIDMPEIEVYRQEGRPGRQTIETIINSMSLRSISEQEIKLVLEKKADVLLELGDPPIQFGAEKLVSVIAESGLEIWVVTGANRPGVAEKLEKDFKFITAGQVITGEDYNIGKPNPEPYLIASKRAQISPQQAIVIENAPLGIESADRSGAFCMAVNTGKLEDIELFESGARVVFNDCNQLADLWPKVLQVLKA